MEPEIDIELTGFEFDDETEEDYFVYPEWVRNSPMDWGFRI